MLGEKIDGDAPPSHHNSKSKMEKKEEYSWPHGITPPLRWVRKRRFRKRIDKAVGFDLYSMCRHQKDLIMPFAKSPSKSWSSSSNDWQTQTPEPTRSTTVSATSRDPPLLHVLPYIYVSSPASCT